MFTLFEQLYIWKVYGSTTLPELLKHFKSGKGHLAVVVQANNSGPGDPFYETVGIVTLEDVIEELLQVEQAHLWKWLGTQWINA